MKMNYAFKISMNRLEGQMPNKFISDYVAPQIIYSDHVEFHNLKKKSQKYTIHSAHIKRYGIQ